MEVDVVVVDWTGRKQHLPRPPRMKQSEPQQRKGEAVRIDAVAAAQGTVWRAERADVVDVAVRIANLRRTWTDGMSHAMRIPVRRRGRW